MKTMTELQTKLQEKSKEEQLKLIFEWSKTSVISFTQFKELLQMIA